MPPSRRTMSIGPSPICVQASVMPSCSTYWTAGAATRVLPVPAALADRLEPHDVCAEDGDEPAVRVDLDEGPPGECGAALFAVRLDAQLVAGAQVDDQRLGHRVKCD